MLTPPEDEQKQEDITENVAQEELVESVDCLPVWYYAKRDGSVGGPYYGCEDIDNDGKPWCAIKAVSVEYYNENKYGTDWAYCYDNDETGCVKGKWYSVKSDKNDDVVSGPFEGCAEDGKSGPWCATKVAYIAGEKFGTKWRNCDPDIDNKDIEDMPKTFEEAVEATASLTGTKCATEGKYYLVDEMATHACSGGKWLSLENFGVGDMVGTSSSSTSSENEKEGGTTVAR